MKNEEIKDIIIGLSLLWLLPMSYHWTKHLIDVERKKRQCFFCNKDCFAKDILIEMSDKK